MRARSMCIAVIMVFALGTVVSAQAIQKIDGQSDLSLVNRGQPLKFDVNGQSTVCVNGTASTVEFVNIDGQSFVDLSRLQSDVLTIKRLNGQCVVYVWGHNITLPDIDGQCTVVAVVRCNGVLRVGNMNGQSRVLWRRERPTDPKPQVSTGNLDGRSRVKELTLQ